MIFEKLLDKLPNIKKMYQKGIHGPLRTCHPPITVPAWMVMMTGKNPGKLGIYGFRHRKNNSDRKNVPKGHPWTITHLSSSNNCSGMDGHDDRKESWKIGDIRFQA